MEWVGMLSYEVYILKVDTNSFIRKLSWLGENHIICTKSHKRSVHSKVDIEALPLYLVILHCLSLEYIP